MNDACATPGLLSVEAARQRLLAAAVPLTDTETVAIDDACGRVLAADQLSCIDVPPADNSAMDGFALRLDDLRAAGGVLPVAQRIPAGTVPAPLAPGTAARIFTGAQIPAGADTVLMQEDCSHDARGLSVPADCLAALRPGSHIRPRGQDLAAGGLVCARGTRLTPAAVGLLASAGLARVPVFRRLRVAIFSTGDELLQPGQPPQPGRIYNANRYLLHAWLREAGCVPVDLGLVPDDRAATIAALQAAAAQADLVISTGGASVGEEDHLRPALQAAGEVDLWKIAVKPGKPLLFGHVRSGGGDTPVLGLPGNPVSVAVTFLLFALPLLRTAQGGRWQPPAGLPVSADFAVPRPGGREEYLRVRLVSGPAGPRLSAFANQSSGVLTSMAHADGLARIPVGRTVVAGDMVDYLPLFSFFT